MAWPTFSCLHNCLNWPTMKFMPVSEAISLVVQILWKQSWLLFHQLTDHQLSSWQGICCSNLQYILVYYDLVRFFSLNRILDWYKDKLSITTVIFIRSENNLALLQLYMLLGTSEHMLWIQSMLRVTCGNRGLTIGCNCLGYNYYYEGVMVIGKNLF